MLLFIICSLKSWILDSKRLYSVGRQRVSAGRGHPQVSATSPQPDEPRKHQERQPQRAHRASCPRTHPSSYTNKECWQLPCTLLSQG